MILVIYTVIAGVVLIMLLIHTFGGWRDKGIPVLKGESFWMWSVFSVFEIVGKVLAGIFSTAPFKLLAKIPGALWEFGGAVFNSILNNMIKLGVGLGILSIAMEFAHGRIELIRILGNPVTRFMLDPYARYVALLSILCSVYGYWRMEVKS